MGDEEGGRYVGMGWLVRNGFIRDVAKVTTRAEVMHTRRDTVELRSTHSSGGNTASPQRSNNPRPTFRAMTIDTAPATKKSICDISESLPMYTRTACMRPQSGATIAN